MSKKLAAWMLATFAVCVAGLGGFLSWYQLPQYQSFYTDADTIRVATRATEPRDILWQPPQPLSELLNTGTEDYEPRVSWDGLTLFFVRGKPGENADIYTATRTPDGWTTPAPLAAVCSEYDDLGPEPSKDGASLYFYSNRPDGFGGYDLWVSHLADGEWQPPENLGTTVNSEFNEYGPTVSPAGDVLYFASNRPRATDERQPDPNAWPATVREDLFHRTYDLYIAQRSQRGWNAAEPLATLNTPFNEGAPCLTPAGDFLYFSSDRPGGQGGFDLYRAWRVQGNLRAAVNLGPPVNTAANELDAGLGALGYALYFSSDRRSQDIAAGQPRQYDLYYSTSREVFRESEAQQRPPIDWAALWRAIGPNLLWALLALLLLLLLLALLGDVRRRRLSLLVRCLLASLMLHLLLMMLLNFWEVAAGALDVVQGRGSIQVALAPSGSADEITRQIRGELTAIEAPEALEFEATPQALEVAYAAATEAAEFDVSEAPEHVTRQVRPEVYRDARPPEESARAPAEVDVEQAAAAALEVALPAESSRMAEAEAPLELEAPRVELQEAALAANSEALPNPAASHAELTPARAAAAPEAAVQEAASAAIDAARPELPRAAAPAAVEALEVPHAPALAVAMPEQDAQLTGGEMAAPAPAAPAVELTRAPADEVLAGAPNAATANANELMPAQATGVEMRRIEGDLAEAAAQQASPAVRTATPSADSALAVEPPPALALALPDDSASAEAHEHDAAAALAPAGPAAERSEIRELAASATQPPALAELIPEQQSQSTSTDALREWTAEVADAAPSARRDDAREAGAAVALNVELHSLALPTMDDAAAAAREEPRRPDVPAAANAALMRADVPRMIDAQAEVQHAELSPDSADTRRFNGHSTKPPLAAPLPSPTPATEFRLAAYVDAPKPADAPALKLPLPQEFSLPVAASPYAQRNPNQRDELLERMGGTSETEQAVQRALRWLAAHQSADGHWDGATFDEQCGACGGQTEYDVDVALTGLSLLCFLGAGHTHTGEGVYQQNVQRGITWLLARQKPDGDLRDGETMYSQGIATIALAETFGMTQDPALADPVRRAAEFILRAQHPRTGGWRYDPGDEGDTAVLGWQVMALRSAELAGVPMSVGAYRGAERWLDSVEAREGAGRYRYQPGEPVSATMTAEALFIRQLLGTPPEDQQTLRSLAHIAEYLPAWEPGFSTYFWYFGTLANFHHGGQAWQQWNDALQAALLPNQERDGPAAGSWAPEGDWADVGGRVYQTALCTLMLETYYRYLPLYVRESEDRPPGTIHGRVTRAASGVPLPGVTIRLDRAGAPPLTAETDADGRYELKVDQAPDFFAISAAHPQFRPESRNVAARALRRQGVQIDFSLEPLSAQQVVIEAVPEVHHLGNDRFEGSINSQFQKTSEGRTFSATFTLSPDQLAILEVRLTMLVKGAQCPHPIVLNGEEVARLRESPRDGSFGEIEVRIDPRLLEVGENELVISTHACRGDLDDYEFVNVQLTLVPLP